MRRNCVLIAALALVCVIFPAIAQASQSAQNGIELNIRFYDRRVYYVADDPIFVQISITNNSPATYRFKLADDRVFSLDFDTRTVSNRALEPSVQLIRKRTQVQHVFFREIAVEPGESFSFVEDLRSYVHISEAGSFVVWARMHPELIRSREEAIVSNRLSLNVRPPLIIGPDGIPTEMDIATGAVLVRQRMAPDQVVEYMINARQRSQWERFFLYLDLEKMLQEDAVRNRRWIAESEEGRRRMVELFKEELRGDSSDTSISLVPSDYIIERTEYSGFEGTVTVLKSFRNNHFTENKRYTYILSMNDNIWTIVNYSVVNLGTE